MFTVSKYSSRKKNAEKTLSNDTRTEEQNKKNEHPDKDILGKKCQDIFWSPLCNTENCPMRQILAGKKRVEYESVKESPTGKIINYWVIGVPLYDTNGKLAGILESFRDITERLEDDLAMEKAFEDALHLVKESLEGIRGAASRRLQSAAAQPDVHEPPGQRGPGH